MKKVKELSDRDVGSWATYTPDNERGKIKSFNNERRVAFVVFKCNNNWDMDHWMDYTAQSVKYEDLSL